MAVAPRAEGDESRGLTRRPIKRIGDTRTGPRTLRPHMVVLLNAEIMARPAEFVTREIPRICRGIFLVDRADQTEVMRA